MANASVEKLWQQAVKSAGAAFADLPRPQLPALSMPEVGFALLHFLELLDGQVPENERAAWQASLSRARQDLMEGPPREAGHPFARIETAASWSNLAHALQQVALRARYAPGLANVAQRAVVSIALSLVRRAAADRTVASERIDEALARLSAGLWLAEARSRLGDAAARIARGWWAAPSLALFSTTDGPWWLVTLAPRKAPRIEAGARDDLLAMIPDAHFARCVTTVMREFERPSR